MMSCATSGTRCVLSSQRGAVEAETREQKWLRQWNETVGPLRLYGYALHGVSSDHPDVAKQIQTSLNLAFPLRGDPQNTLAHFLRIRILRSKLVLLTTLQH